MGLRELKAQVMTSARAAGKNPVTTWQDTEKALEIDRNLRRFKELGLEVHYHSCDVTDRSAVASTLEKVRQISGPIQECCMVPASAKMPALIANSQKKSINVSEPRSTVPGR